MRQGGSSFFLRDFAYKLKRVVTRNIFCSLCIYHEFGLAGQNCKIVLFFPGGYLFASFASVSCFSPAVIYLLVMSSFR